MMIARDSRPKIFMDHRTVQCDLGCPQPEQRIKRCGNCVVTSIHTLNTTRLKIAF